jgi:NAD+ synthase
MEFHRDILKIDSEAEIERICDFIREHVRTMKREGLVIGISGGIDSALCAELCVKTLGNDRVFGLILPEKESDPRSAEYAKKQAEKLGIAHETVDITPALEAIGTYDKRDHFVKRLVPEYTSEHKLKITLPADLLSRDAYNFYTLTIDDGKGHTKQARLDKTSLNGIVAATDTKQRTRMIHLYYYAEKMNRLVCGTTNYSETVQGFFVKFGDGGVDIEPIAHLYKTQVYQLSAHLGVIEEIQERAPSPDTFNYGVSDEEFYFRIPYKELDYLLWAWENQIDIKDVCKVMDLAEEQVSRAFRDFSAKHKATAHLRELPPTLTN